MKRIVIFDTEYWADEGSMARGWRGVDDQLPLLVQIGAVELEMREDRSTRIGVEFCTLVKPVNERGDVPIPAYLTELTGITQHTVDTLGRDLVTVLNRFDAFCGSDVAYSFGRDAGMVIAPSCYAAGVHCRLRRQQLRDIRPILRGVGALPEDASSGELGVLLGAPGARSGGHDALADARELANVVAWLWRTGVLGEEWVIGKGETS
jgi:hypothetical protein